MNIQLSLNYYYLKLWYIYIAKSYVIIMTDVKQYVYIYIQLETQLHMYLTIIYIHNIHDDIYIRKYGTMYLQVCKNWIHIKKRN